LIGLTRMRDLGLFDQRWIATDLPLCVPKTLSELMT
jgi:hypothetical protein